MVVTDDRAMAETMRSLRNQGRDADGTWLRHVRLGYVDRLDELSAAVGVAPVERLLELRGRGRAVVAFERSLGGRDWVRLARAGADEDVDWFVYVVRLHPDSVATGHRPAGGPRLQSRPSFAADPPAALLSAAVWVPAARFPGHRAGRGLDPRPPILKPVDGRGRPVRGRLTECGGRQVGNYSPELSQCIRVTMAASSGAGGVTAVLAACADRHLLRELEMIRWSRRAPRSTTATRRAPKSSRRPQPRLSEHPI